MCNLPPSFLPLPTVFAPAFGSRVWEWAVVLVIGAGLMPAARTVAKVLRVMGRQHLPHFQNYHRVLNRARRSSRELIRLLLSLLLDAFASSDAPVIIGMDYTIERRRAPKIAARGISRDPVCSSKEYFVKVSGPRWL